MVPLVAGSRQVLALSDELMEFFLAQGSSPIQTIMGRGRRATNTLVIEVLLNHFKDHRPNDHWVERQIANRKFSDLRLGRPRGSKDRFPRSRGANRSRFPKEVAKGMIIAGMLDAMIKDNRGQLLDMREDCMHYKFSWQKLETEAQKDFDQHHGGTEERDDDSNRNSDSEDGGGDKALPEEGKKVQMPWEW